MRFAVAEINNSTQLLPNVRLGYELLDHCSDTQCFPGILKLLSVDNVIRPWNAAGQNASKVVAVVGIFTSTFTLTVAPLFMMDFIPLVPVSPLSSASSCHFLFKKLLLFVTSPQISYGSSTSIFSENAKFPSFLRTVHSSKEVMLAIVKLLQYFQWHWVAFLYTSDDYGTDGQKMFMERIKNTEICLAYTNDLGNTDLRPILQQINAQKINVIVVFAPEWAAKRLIQSAIRNNMTDKVWIAAEAWSLNKELPKEKGIKKIGTVIGVSQLSVTIPGFDRFIYSAKKQNGCESAEQQFCNQACNCSEESAEDILAADPSFTFPVYSAVYAAAHALHNVLNCGSGRCDNGVSISPPAVRVS